MVLAMYPLSSEFETELMDLCRRGVLLIQGWVMEQLEGRRRICIDDW